MPNIRKVNSNGPGPGCPRDGTPVDRALDRAGTEALSRDVIGVSEAQRSQEMADDLMLEDAQREKRRGVGIHTTKAPWLRNPGA